MFVSRLIDNSDFQLFHVTQQNLNKWLGILSPIQHRPVEPLEFLLFFVQTIRHALQIRALLTQRIAPASAREFEEVIVIKLNGWLLIAIGVTNTAPLNLHDVTFEDSHGALQFYQTRASFGKNGLLIGHAADQLRSHKSDDRKNEQGNENFDQGKAAKLMVVDTSQDQNRPRNAAW